MINRDLGCISFGDFPMTTEGALITVEMFFHCSLAGLAILVEDLDNGSKDFLRKDEENSFLDLETKLVKDGTGILIFMGLVHLLYVAIV